MYSSRILYWEHEVAYLSYIYSLFIFILFYLFYISKASECQLTNLLPCMQVPPICLISNASKCQLAELPYIQVPPSICYISKASKCRLLSLNSYTILFNLSHLCTFLGKVGELCNCSEIVINYTQSNCLADLN